MDKGAAAVIETELGRDALLARIDELPEARYRSVNLGDIDDPLAETIYILLSDQTHESVYRRLFVQLRRRYPQRLDVLTAPEEELVVLLEPGGFFRQRAQKLEAACRRRDRGAASAALVRRPIRLAT